MDPNRVESHLPRAVHWTLLAGLAVTATFLVAGLVLAGLGGRGTIQDKAPPLTFLFSQAARREGRALLELGLLILAATPALRVAVLALGWSLARNWLFAGIATAVLTLLALSVILGTG